MLTRAQIEETVRRIAENAQKLGLSPEDIVAQQTHFRAQHARRELVSNHGIKETTMAAINFTGNTTLENLKKRYADEIDSKTKQENILENIKTICKTKCSIRIMGTEIPKYHDGVQKGKEILIIKKENQFEIVCRNQKNYHLMRFTCNESLSALLHGFDIGTFDNYILSWEFPRTSTCIYDEVAAHQGYIQNDVALDALEYYAPNNSLTLCLWWCAATDVSSEITSTGRIHAFMLALENSVRGNNRNRALTLIQEDGTKKEIADPAENDDGDPNKPVCRWGLQNQLALCMQESHDAAHPDNVYIPDLADAIQTGIQKHAQAYYANNPYQAQIKAAIDAVSDAAIAGSVAKPIYVRNFEKFSKTVSTAWLKAFYNKHGHPTSPKDKSAVNDTLRAVINNLHYLELSKPSTGLSIPVDFEFTLENETLESKELTELYEHSSTSDHNANATNSHINTRIAPFFHPMPGFGFILPHDFDDAFADAFGGPIFSGQGYFSSMELTYAARHNDGSTILGHPTSASRNDRRSNGR